MSLTVGTDTYISLADANTYVNSHYATTQTEYTSWTALSDANKEVYLRKALQKIDRQLLIGQKALQTQTLQFPRAYKVSRWNRVYVQMANSYYRGDLCFETSVSTAVKEAQVEEALALVKGLSSRIQLQREGVTSFSLGKLSESFDGSKKSTQALQSDEAKELIKPYLAGSVDIV